MAALSEGTPYFTGPSPAYINGLLVSWKTATTLTLTQGICTDSTGTCQIALTNSASIFAASVNNSSYSSYVSSGASGTVTLNAANVGVNGMDTGALAAQTVYGVYVIDNSLNNQSYPCAGLISATLSGSPALPQGYDIYRLVGYMATDGSKNFINGYATGNGNARYFQYDSIGAVLTNGAATSFSQQSLNPYVPALTNVEVDLYASYNPVTAGNKATFRTGGGTASTGFDITGVVAAKAQDVGVRVVTGLESGAACFDYKVANATDTLSVSVWGYRFYV